MKRWAPLILLVVAAVVFLLIMGSEDGSWVAKGAFLQMAPQMLFIHSLFVFWLIKHRQKTLVAIYGWFSVMLLLAIIRMGGFFHEELVAMSPKLGGRLLFSLAVIDIIAGFYLRRPLSKTRADRPADSRKCENQ